MPEIQLAVPAGALTDEGRATVQKTLADVLLKWKAPRTMGSSARRPGPTCTSSRMVRRPLLATTYHASGST
jgi:hypothetical protein